LSGCHILIENSAIFITKCNEFSGRYLIAIFEKKNRKNFQNNKNATLPLYVFCLTTESLFLKAYFNPSFQHKNPIIY